MTLKYMTTTYTKTGTAPHLHTKHLHIPHKSTGTSTGTSQERHRTHLGTSQNAHRHVYRVTHRDTHRNVYRASTEHLQDAYKNPIGSPIGSTIIGTLLPYLQPYTASTLHPAHRTSTEAQESITAQPYTYLPATPRTRLQRAYRHPTQRL